jgi:hypothetical protein
VITLALPRPAAALAAAHMSPSGAGAINRPIPAGTMTVVVVANGGNRLRLGAARARLLDNDLMFPYASKHEDDSPLAAVPAVGR